MISRAERLNGCKSMMNQHGKSAMARFVEEIIAVRGERTSDGRLVINEGCYH